MINLQGRIDLLVQLGEYLTGNEPGWLEVKERASRENPWFIPEFIELSANNIAHQFLQRKALEDLAKRYALPDINPHPFNVGLVTAGNLPLVGFHDILCIFLSGHYAFIKPSSKDEVLTKHVIEKLTSWNKEAPSHLVIKDRLNNCDAYIATGSNNTSRYFDYYFGKYPHIIRRNRTSVAVLTGEESETELEKLSDDVCQYFGRGCRNVTHIFVPEHYEFLPLVNALKKYDWLADHNKYRNNYDHNLAIHILNNKYYMTNSSVLLVENSSLFAPVSELHYSFYKERSEVEKLLTGNQDVQCVVGRDHLPFGQAQCPSVDSFADGVDTLAFLSSLEKTDLRRS